MTECAVTGWVAGAVVLALCFGGCATTNAGQGAATPPNNANAASVPAPESAAPAAGGAGATTTGGGGSASADQQPKSGSAAEKRTLTVIRKVVMAHRKEVRACYDEGRKQLPSLEGNLTIHFVLSPEGKVEDAELNLARSDIKAPSVVDCAIKIIKAIQFPPSSRGMETTVNYPFNFHH